MTDNGPIDYLRQFGSALCQVKLGVPVVTLDGRVTFEVECQTKADYARLMLPWLELIAMVKVEEAGLVATTATLCDHASNGR